MQMMYNVDYEIAAAVFAGVLYMYLSMQYSNNAKVNREFKTLIFYCLCANVADVVSGNVFNHRDVLPSWTFLLANTAYFVVAAFLGYQFSVYAATYLYKEKKEGNRIISGVVLVSYIILLVINLYAGNLFSMNADKDYVHGPMYLVVYAVPGYYIGYAFIKSMINIKEYDVSQRIGLVTFYILCAAGMIIQCLFVPYTLVAMFSITVGALVMMFLLETPDYQQLLQTTGDLKEAKEEAQAANRAKTEFLANMSHELKTPINAVLGYNEMIARETEKADIVDYTKNVDAAGKTLLSIVNDILDFSQLDSGKNKLEYKDYDVAEFFEHIMIYAKNVAREKDLLLEFDIAPEVPCVLKSDPVRLAQIFNNLISNAIKYTKIGSVKVKVGFNKIDDTSGIMSVSVKDTGNGMTPEDVQRITDSFTRGDVKNNRNVQGVGLGLAVVTNILDLMGSELRIDSTYGKGSEFSFEIKQTIVNGSSVNKQVRQKKNYKENYFVAPRARVLVVDDNKINLDLFKGILKDTKMYIETAMDGRQAVEKVEQGSFDIIFLDIMMPVMDGYETLWELRKRKLCEGVPVIAFTANATESQNSKFLERGFTDLLVKPIVLDTLLTMLRKYIPAEYIHKEGGQRSVVKEGGFLEGLDFLDVETGLEYCGNDESFYREMLGSFYDSVNIGELESLYDKKDWAGYRTKVHAIKSTSMSIGAVDLSLKAKQLENAAKEERMAYIELNHGIMIDALKNLMDKLGDIVIKEERISTEGRDAKDMQSILVVDDNTMNLRMAEKILSKEYLVYCAQNYIETFEVLKTKKVNVILLDLHMPDMDGFTMINTLKADEKYKEIPVIFLTADNDRQTEIDGFKAGVLDFIRKPFVADIMLQRVSRILELDRLQNNLKDEVKKQTNEARERRIKVERLSFQALITLASTIDAKDKYTNGHSTRVAGYSKEIARRLGKSEKEQEDIYYMGLLHDIGKIGIPDEIINKRSKLSDEEYNKIKEHPVIGSDILKNISEIPGIAIGARWHHERYDGKGYPDGLVGEDIPEVARIIGVADAYDAMTSNRSYRDLMPQNKVRSEIENGKGTQFDPVIAMKMLEIIDEDKDYTLKEIREE